MATPTHHSHASTQVLAFDIFGTVVDWHGSIVREMAERFPTVWTATPLRSPGAPATNPRWPV